MTSPVPTPPASPAAASVCPEKVTELILRIFRLNGALIADGDRLVSETGLTSARWQLLGGIADQAEPLSVAQLARKIGNTRQAVQRIANDLAAEGVIAFRANPRHKRAQLVELTPRGARLFERTMELQRPWAAALGSQLSDSQVNDALDTLGRMLLMLDPDAAIEPAAASSDDPAGEDG